MLQVARRAYAAVVNFLDTGIATLLHDLRGEIDFVMRRANAWAELRYEIRRRHAKFLMQRPNRVRDNTESTSLFSRVHETDRALPAINQENRATIGHKNPEADTSLIGNHAIAVFETATLDQRRINDRNCIPVDLARGDERATLQAELAPRVVVNLIEIRKHDRLVVGQLDSRHPPHKSVRKPF